MAKNKTKKPIIQYPAELLRPIRDMLASTLALLEKRKKNLEEEDPYKDNSRLNDNAAIDADAAEEVGHMEVSALKHSVDRKIVQIRKAMTMIKLGKYGICEKCGRLIDTDRLMIMPETTLCIDDERKREK